MKNISGHRLIRLFLYFPVVVMALCILGASASAVSNSILPSRSAVTDRLSELDKARVSEALHLRRALGDLLWQGWGSADIPMIFYNEDNAFLIGYSNPPEGWRKIPEFESRGGSWEVVPEDTFNGKKYYRQSLASGVTPEAFIVRIGDRWVSNLLTADWMEIKMGNEFRGLIPSPLQPVLPYRQAARWFLSAAGGEDLYICATLHESFHAFEALQDKARLLAAETVYNQNAHRYPYGNPVFAAEWQTELDKLADAVLSISDADTIELARQFLDARRKRRAEAGMDALLINLERLKEWEEGLAKYTELAIWRLAAEESNYTPLPAMAGDPGFSGYKKYNQIWLQQIQQIRSMAKDDGDIRFYYSGWAQAILLDRLAPGWRTRILSEDVTLEDLLREAVK
jgi:hypothetical protein